LFWGKAHCSCKKEHLATLIAAEYNNSLMLARQNLLLLQLLPGNLHNKASSSALFCQFHLLHNSRMPFWQVDESTMGFVERECVRLHGVIVIAYGEKI
jgi:hypothetical protein